MGLKTFSAGDNKLASYTKTTRNLRDAGETYYNLEEVVQNEVREWVGLTLAAATGAVSSGSGEGSMTLVSGTGTTYQHDSNEDNRIVGSYTYRCSAEKKTISFPES